jgi:hypothetical protein
MDGKHKYQFRVTRTVQKEVVIEVESSSLTEAYANADRYAQFGELPAGATIGPVKSTCLEHEMILANPLSKAVPTEGRVLH